MHRRLVIGIPDKMILDRLWSLAIDLINLCMKTNLITLNCLLLAVQSIDLKINSSTEIKLNESGIVIKTPINSRKSRIPTVWLYEI